MRAHAGGPTQPGLGQPDLPHSACKSNLLYRYNLPSRPIDGSCIVSCIIPLGSQLTVRPQ